MIERIFHQAQSILRPTQQRRVNTKTAQHRIYGVRKSSRRNPIKVVNNRIRSLKHLPLAVFLRELLVNPRNVGAACPSSKKLADSMAAFVSPADDGLIVELGAGTGVVTAALLRQGVQPRRLIVVERSAKLVDFLQKRFPELTIIHGDAVALEKLLEENLPDRVDTVSAVVSSLPMRSLPSVTAKAIAQQIDVILATHGRLIQFTYDLRPLSLFFTGRFVKSNSKIVWRNLPPARVEVLRRGEH